jgi:hypothetical protein
VLVVRDGVGDQRLLVDCLIPGYFAKLTIASAISAFDPVDACEIRRTARRVVRCSGPAFEERRHAGCCCLLKERLGFGFALACWGCVSRW